MGSTGVWRLAVLALIAVAIGGWWWSAREAPAGVREAAPGGERAPSRAAGEVPPVRTGELEPHDIAEPGTAQVSDTTALAEPDTSWRITGIVLREGAPAAHAEVRTAFGGVSSIETSTVTDAQGRFALRIAGHGMAPLEATHEEVWRGSVTVEQSAPDDVRIELARGARVRVRVVEPSGEPVEGARVNAAITDDPRFQYFLPQHPEMEELRAFQALTDRDGWATLSILVAGTYDVEAEHDARGVVVEAHALDPAATTTRELVLTIRGGGALWGRVTAPDGQPWAGEEVFLSPEVASSLFGHRAAVTDEDGRYRIAGVEPGRYQLRLEGSPCSERAEALEMPAGRDLELDVLSQERGVITGVVVDEGGAALRGLRVAGIVVGGSIGQSDTTSDGAGRFVLPVCTNRRYRLSASPKDRGPQRTEPVVASEGDDVVLRFVEGATLTVDVAFVGGPPPESFAVRVQVVDRESREPRVTIADLRPGSWPVRVDAPGYQRQDVRAELLAGKTTHLPLTLRRGLELRGRVIDAQTRAGLEGVVVLATPTSDVDGTETVTDAAGGFVLDGLAEQSYRLLALGRAVGRGYTDARAGPVDVGAATPPVELPLVRGVTLRGRVRDGRRPVWRAFVLLAREDGGFAADGTSGRDGAFEIAGLSPGVHRWAVTVGTGGSRRTRSGTVDVPAQGQRELDVDLDGSGGRIAVVLPDGGDTVLLELFVGRVSPSSAEHGRWSEFVRGQHRVSFDGLEPGEYTLVARAQGERGQLTARHTQVIVVASADSTMEVLLPR